MMHDSNYRNLDNRDRFIQMCNEVETALRGDRPSENSAYNDRQASPANNFTTINVDLDSYFGTTGERLRIPRNFIFYLEKNKLGIKIGTRPTRAILVLFQKIIPALLLFIVCELAFITVAQKIVNPTHLVIGVLIVAIAIVVYTFFQIQDSLIKTTITPTHIHVKGCKYERRREIIFYIFSSDTNQIFSWQVYFIAPNRKVYLAKYLTRPEAEELLKILTKIDLLYSEQRVSFSIKKRDDLIFLSSNKTTTSFVIDYDERLWQSIRCRINYKGKAELTKSELTELYQRRLQTLS